MDQKQSNEQKLSQDQASEVSPINPHSKRKLLIYGFVAVAGILALAIGSYVLGTQNTTKSSEMKVEESVTGEIDSSSSKTSNWKTYTLPDINVSLEYPSSWEVTQTSREGKVDQVIFSGKEGVVKAAWGSGFGGGCDVENEEIIQFFGKSQKICHYTANDEESWGQLIKSINTTTTLSLNATAYPPTSKNSKLVEQILSSFNFTDQDTSTSPTANEYTDTKYNFSFVHPDGYFTEVKDFPENKTRIVYIKKTSAPEFGYSFSIKPNWDNTGNTKDQPRNITVGGVPAYRGDPPSMESTKLQSYQTTVAFEKNGNVYFFACPHNWVGEYLKACESILTSFKFN